MTTATDRGAQELVTGTADTLVTLIGVLSETSTSIDELAEAAVAAWALRLGVSGALAGSLNALLPADTAARLAALEAGSSDAVSDDSLPKHLTDLWRRLLGDLAGRPGLEDVIVTIDACERIEAGASGGDVTWYALAVGDLTLPIGFQASVRAASAERRASEGTGLPSNLEVVLDIDLQLSVRFGLTQMTLASLSRIGPGSVIELDRAPEEPVDVLVNGKLVARGEVVVVAGNYGVRVTEVVSAADRIRSLGA